MKKLHALALAASLSMGLALPAHAAECIGNCGTSIANGVVVTPPSGSDTYSWVSTFMGPMGGGLLPGSAGEGTNGSTLVSDPFFARAGSKVEFWFNYVTSDGEAYADYAWAELRGATSSTVLFTARTKETGTIVPGTDLPPVRATLTPAAVEITPNQTTWAPLGESSGECYGPGCGFTGWIQSSYTVEEDGTYNLAFGVSNWQDEDLQSGLAFQGLLLDGAVIGDGRTAEEPLLPTELTPAGAFVFEFTPTPAVPVFIDPLIAVGYDYQILSGSNLITSALFPVLAGDPDGYEIYELGNVTASGLLGTVMGGTTFAFGAGGVTGFSLRGISQDALLDPANPTAFVTGLTFLDGSPVSISQLPVTVNVVPEPEQWALVLAGLLVLPVARRIKRAA